MHRMGCLARAVRRFQFLPLGYPNPPRPASGRDGGVVVASAGNVSARTSAHDAIAITPTSISYDVMTADQVVVVSLESGLPIESKVRPSGELPTHLAVYRRRQDVGAVVHTHAPSVIPFGVTGVPLRPIYHMGSVIGHEVPVWDIAKRFGDTDLLVRDAAQGDDLVAALGMRTVVLMRGHGCVVTGTDVRAAVFAAVYLARNATLLAEALRLGEVRSLSAGETQRAAAMLRGNAGERAWEYWVRRLPPRA